MFSKNDQVRFNYNAPDLVSFLKRLEAGNVDPDEVSPMDYLHTEFAYTLIDGHTMSVLSVRPDGDVLVVKNSQADYAEALLEDYDNWNDFCPMDHVQLEPFCGWVHAEHLKAA